MLPIEPIPSWDIIKRIGSKLVGTVDADWINLTWDRMQ
jgi:hypothetical protein